MADPDDRRTDGAPPTHVHVGPEHKGTNWLAWLALLAGILALLFALSRCGRDERVATEAPAAAAVNETAPAAAPVADAGAVVATTPNAATSEAVASEAVASGAAGTSAIGGFLAGTEPAPRSFQFEKLNFDSGKSDVRPADAAEVNEVAATLKQYGTARIRIAGYADARGPGPANMTLGKARADAIKAALVAQGIDAGRIETVSGGETDPVDSNAHRGRPVREPPHRAGRHRPLNPVSSRRTPMSRTITALFDTRRTPRPPRTGCAPPTSMPITSTSMTRPAPAIAPRANIRPTRIAACGTRSRTRSCPTRTAHL